MSPPGESLRTDPAERANRQWKRAAVAVATGQMQPIDAKNPELLKPGKALLKEGFVAGGFYRH